MSQEGDRAAAGVPDHRARGRSCASCGFTSFVTPDVRRGRRARRAADHDPGADVADRRPDRRLVAVGVTTASRRVLNQNDARPSDLTSSRSSARSTRYLVQFSGAIWFPMVYELPARAKQALGSTKRERQFDRTLRYIDELGARFVFPTAGPPCFLDEELWGFNDIFGDESNIFPDQTVYLDWLRVAGPRRGPAAAARHGRRRSTEPDCPVDAPVRPGDDLRRQDETATCARCRRGGCPRSRRRRRLGAPRDRHPRRAARSGSRRCCEEADHMAAGIDGGVRFTCEDAERGDVDVLLDFVAREVRAVRRGEGALPVPHPARVRRAADRRARDRLGQLAVPVLPVLRAAHRPVQRVRLRVLQVPVRGAAQLRRGLVRRAERRRGGRDDHARRLGRAAALPAPEGRPDPVRLDRRTTCSPARCTAGSGG